MPKYDHAIICHCRPLSTDGQVIVSAKRAAVPLFTQPIAPNPASEDRKDGPVGGNNSAYLVARYILVRNPNVRFFSPTLLGSRKTERGKWTRSTLRLSHGDVS